MDSLEVELLVKLLFIFGLLFLLWVGQEVVILFVCTSKEELSIYNHYNYTWSIYEACMDRQID